RVAAPPRSEWFTPRLASPASPILSPGGHCLAVPQPPLVFLSDRAEIPWAARLARQVGRQGCSAELWVFDEEERQLGEASGAFEAVLDLTRGFDRFALRDPEETRAALGRLRAIEVEVGCPVFHRDAASDRRLTGFDQIEIPRADIASR